MATNTYPGESAFGYDTVSFGLAQPIVAGSDVPGRHRYLIVFRHRHLNFRLAEAQAIAETAYGAFVYRKVVAQLASEVPASLMLRH